MGPAPATRRERGVSDRPAPEDAIVGRGGRGRAEPFPAASAAAFALVVAALLAPCAAAGQESNSLFGRPVVSIAFAADGEVDREDVARMVTIRTGRPLTDEDTAETIRNLYASQQFSDVRVEATPVGEGVAVRLVLLRAFIVYGIHFSGHRGVSREELRRVIGFNPGVPYAESDVTEGSDAIRRRLVLEGFPSAAVTPRVEFDRRRFRVEVTYRIDSGARARVAPPIFNGSLAPYSEEDFRAKARLHPGNRYRESRALADANRMREFLHGHGRLKGQVELIAAQPAGEGQIAPVYRVVVGPEVVFEAQGISAKKLQREVHQRLEGQVFDEDLILQYVDEKKAEFQRKGYYRAKVTYRLDQTPERVTVAVTAEPGTKYAVERIELQGNASVSDKTLRRLMVTTPKGLPLVRPGRLSDDDLRADVNGILGWYQSHGWIRAKVGPAEVADGSKPDRLVVRVPIEEGPRTLVAKREIAGDAQAVTPDLEQSLAVKPGQPFDPNRLRQDAFTLQTHLRDRGWLEAAVRDEYRVSPDGTSADVIYHVVEGPRSFFGKTVVRGNAATRTDRMRRLADWREGAPFSEEKMLEAQRRLSRTGSFQRVEVRPDPSRPGGGERNVQIEVQEARPLSLLYGFGYQYVPEAAENRNDPFVVAGVTTHNLFGGMRSAGLEGQIALSGRFRVQASFRDPFLISNDYAFVSALFASRETIQDVNLERFGFVNEMSHTFGNYLRGSMRLEYQRIRPTNPEALSSGEIEEFPRADQPIEEATIGPAFFYDRRDDPIDPHKGYYLSVAGKYAFPVLSAEARYTKFATQATVFRPIGRAVFAASARFGGIFPYGPTDIQVPIAERFFVGGRSTGRAFETDFLGIPGGTLESVGPNGNATVDYTTQARAHSGEGPGNCVNAYPDVPELQSFDCKDGPRIIGGNSFVTLSAELRAPILGNLGAVVFYDASQTWRHFSQINLRFEGDDGLRQSVGAGLFYMLPIGPLRAEYAWKLTRRTIPFEVVKFVPANDPNNPDKQVPVAVPGTLRTVRESPGQFFVSIGFPF